MYRAFGSWQAALDELEEQMIAWGRLPHHENAKLCLHYTEQMRKLSMDSTGLLLSLKGEWDEEDRRTFGLGEAYAEARYVVRFHTLPDGTLTPLHVIMALIVAHDGTIYATTIYPFTLLRIAAER